jgi:hypothetical protein
MKKILIFSIMFFTAFISYAQSINTIPDTGNVVLGGDTSSVKLKICGNVKIDSSLTVSEDVQAKSDLKVDGDAYFNGNLFFTNGVPLSFNPDQLAVFGSNGQLRGASVNGILPYIYGEDCRTLTDEFGNILSYPAPAWKSVSGANYGILYTGWQCKARVGIGTDNPVAELDVIGKAHIENNVGIGISPNPTVMLNIKETDPSLTTRLIRAEANDMFYEMRNNGETILNAKTSGYAFSLENSDAAGQGIYVGTNSNKYAVQIKNTNSEGQGLYIDGGSGPSASNNYGLINVLAGGKQIFYIDGKNSITYAREIKVNTNATWPDYVFDEEYKRMTPLEKENYFKENKHLPGIAPATEIEKDGIPVSETLNGLTKNVEENSLDINLLFKEFYNLKAENEKLKKEIEELKNKK